ncbi:GTP cyclohydrolase I FolE [Georgenia sp. TF02-10]|uniref:GTP cyclohydrolase I FolE n=1 Tax=Georgenia sp. TF02-10 TaxID=2917725 RepID=UPI00352C7935
MADDAAAGAARAGLATDSAPLHDGDGRQARPYDADGVRRAVRDLLRAVGEDPDRDGLVGTPERVARAYAEMFAGLAEDPADHLEAVFDIGHEEMVIVKDIPVYSVCEHHLLPFHGVAHVGYIPAADGRVTGLSKLARLVEGYARRPQVQERLTAQVADAIVARLAPRGALVVVEAEHLCMSMRGVHKPGARTITSAVRGQMRNAATRAEAMSLMVRG